MSPLPTARSAPRHHSLPAALALPPSALEADDGAIVSFATRLGEQVVTVEPKGAGVRANVVWVHGLSDHSARQLDTARWLSRRGYRTLIYDHIGHGGRASHRPASFWIARHYLEHSNAGRVAQAIRDDPRFTPERNARLAREQFQQLAGTTFEDLARQLVKIVSNAQWLSSDDRDLPLFLIGHSMGALLVAETIWRLAARGRPKVSGVVLLSPALKPKGNPESRSQQLAVETLWRLRRMPFSLTRSALKTLLRFDFAADTTWGNKWLSDQRAEIELFETDPLVPRVLPTGFASSIESQMVRTAKRGAAFPLDGLVMVPGKDGITSVNAGIRFARRVADTVGPDRFRLARFDTVRGHDLMRSSAREEARRLLADWLDEHASSRADSGLGHAA